MIRCIPSLVKRPALLLAAASLFASCAASVDMPKGTSTGYTSARLVVRDPDALPITNATEKQVYGMIGNSISSQFTSHGIPFGNGTADLTVAYLVLYQEPGMTARYDDYFGHGRDNDKISDTAHMRGVLDNKRADFFRQAGIVVDVIDNKTNKLVYRGFAKGDVIKEASPATRSSRIHAAVAQALADFFR